MNTISQDSKRRQSSFLFYHIKRKNPILFSGGHKSLLVSRGQKPKALKKHDMGMTDDAPFHTLYKDVLLKDRGNPIDLLQVEGHMMSSEVTVRKSHKLNSELTLPPNCVRRFLTNEKLGLNSSTNL